jgi:DNA modification methylase
VAVRILIGDVRERLADVEPESVDCVVTSPPYWGLRDYGVDGQIGMESTLGEHLSVMVDVFDLVRRAMKPEATLWLNYGDCYATKPNGRSAAATKATGNDDRTFRDKPFSTVGPIYGHLDREYEKTRRGEGENFGALAAQAGPRVVGVGMLKPKDLCGVPWRVAFALQDRGWWLRQDIIWSKPNPMPESIRDRCTKAHEYLFLMAKSERYYFDQEAIAEPCGDKPAGNGFDGRQGGSPQMPMSGGCGSTEPWTPGKARKLGSKGEETPPEVRSSAGARMGRGAGWRDDPTTTPGSRNRRSVWTVNTAPFPDAHFATFPPDLIEPCILAGCPVGGTVLDPFFGAGTTGLVADRLQRNCIGIELNAEYAELARKRLLNDAGVFADISVEHCGPATRAA